MTSFSEVDGVPATANERLVRRILKTNGLSAASS